MEPSFDPTADAAIERALRNARYELIPLASARQQIRFLPTGASVSVTASPSMGMQATIDLAVELQSQGFAAVPHLAARMVADRFELERLVAPLVARGVRKLFVVGGDATQSGEFATGLDLLRALRTMGLSGFDIGVPGYPEGHHVVDRDTIERALDDKAPFVAYVTTQMCFDVGSISEWVDRLRARGNSLDVVVGVPGVIELVRLMGLSARIGVGGSLRYLKHHRNVAGRLLFPGAYAPDELVSGLAGLLADPRSGVAGLHLYAFNRIEATERWRRSMLASLDRG